MAEYRFTGSHADTLASGRPVAPGEFIELTDEESFNDRNRSMIEEGLLIDVSEIGADIPDNTAAIEAAAAAPEGQDPGELEPVVVDEQPAAGSEEE